MRAGSCFLPHLGRYRLSWQYLRQKTPSGPRAALLWQLAFAFFAGVS